MYLRVDPTIRFRASHAHPCDGFFATAQEGLPHELAPNERPLDPRLPRLACRHRSRHPTPPTFPVRTMAEWEEVQSVVITWTGFPGILKQIVRAAQEECEVIIACDDQAAVVSYLQNASYGGAIGDLTDITFLEANFNSIWSRDYMAETIYANEVDSLVSAGLDLQPPTSAGR